MKKIFVVIFVVFALLLASALPGQAWDRGHWGGGWRGGVWIGPGWGWDPWLWGPPYYPYYGGYNPYYAAPPVVVQQQPQQYVQPAPQQEEQSYYWYFCGNPQGYYPYVKKCPGGWMKVVPPSTPPDYESHGEPAQAPPYQGR